MPRWLLPFGVVALDAVLLLAALTVAFRIPGLRLLTGVPSGSALDYSTRLGPLPGLDSHFVAEAFWWETGADPESTEEVGDAGGAPNDDGIVGASHFPDVHPATNDDFGDARPIRTIPYEARTTSNASTRERDEPAECGPPSGGTLWYQFIPEENSILIADTFGSDHAATVAVYEGSTLSTLKAIGCGTDLQGLALVPFTARAGLTYQFQVSAPTRALNPLVGRGALTFRLSRQGVTTLESVGKAGQANGDSYYPSISGDGRHVAFEATASNLDSRNPVPCPDGPTCSQVYVRDLQKAVTRLVSISSDGLPGNGESGGMHYSNTPELSHDGRFVAFASAASNLATNDRNICSATSIYEGPKTPPAVTCPDVFVHDRDADGDGEFDEEAGVRTTLVSVSSEGEQANDASDVSDISADGRFVVFTSEASNLDAADPMCQTTDPPYLERGCTDVFLHDRDADRDGAYDEPGAVETTRMSVSSTGEPGNADSGGGAISEDGRYVTFSSEASNLVQNDTQMCPARYTTEEETTSNCSDVFVHDRRTGRTVRVSISSSGEPSDGRSGGATMSSDGRHVAFSSTGSNLIEGDRAVCDEVAGGVREPPFTCSNRDVFVHDRDPDLDGILDEPGATSTVLASVNSKGTQADRGIEFATISADGRVVAFTSWSTNLVPQDMNADLDLFVHFLRTGQTMRVSVSNDGATTGGVPNNVSPGISADGRALAWDSKAPMTDDDSTPYWDVFVHRLRWKA